MPTYPLSPKPAVASALAAGVPVSSRLQEIAEAAGYVIGEGGIQVYPDGSVTIDSDRDPSADWETFDPTAPTAQEQLDAALRQAILDAFTDLDLIQAQADTATTNQLRWAIKRLAEIQEGTIRVLIDRGVLA